MNVEKKKPILIVLDDWEGKLSASPCLQEIKEIVDVRFLAGPITEVDKSTLADARFLLAIRERTKLSEQIFGLLPRLELILQTGGHAYHIDQAAAKNRRIQIALGRRVKAPTVAVPELTFALMLSCIHLLPQAQIAMRAGQWPLLLGKTLKGRRLGILGLGRHGSSVARIAKDAFGMDVVAWARSHSGVLANEIPRLSLDDLLRTSDVVSIHLRLSEESKNLLNRERLQLMKNGSILINTSRGAIVDEQALIQALQNGPIAGAGLDVFYEEPLPSNSELRQLSNAVLTPHIGWTVEEAFEEFAAIACQQLREYLRGELDPSELL